MGVKSHDNREDFIKLLSSMSHNDINDYTMTFYYLKI